MAPPAFFLHFAVSAVLLAVFPVLIVTVGLGRRLTDIGLGLGNWRFGLGVLVVGIPMAILAGRIGADSAAMRAVYPLDPNLRPGTFVPYALTAFLYFASWEVLFRGVLLLGLAPRLGDGPANATQTGLSVTAHFGRALSETFAALPGGLVFGYLVLRIRSVWPIAIIHWVVGMSMEYAIIT